MCPAVEADVDTARSSVVGVLRNRGLVKRRNVHGKQRCCVEQLYLYQFFEQSAAFGVVDQDLAYPRAEVHLQCHTTAEASARAAGAGQSQRAGRPDTASHAGARTRCPNCCHPLPSMVGRRLRPARPGQEGGHAGPGRAEAEARAPGRVAGWGAVGTGVIRGRDPGADAGRPPARRAGRGGARGGAGRGRGGGGAVGRRLRGPRAAAPTLRLARGAGPGPERALGSPVNHNGLACARSPMPQGL